MAGVDLDTGGGRRRSLDSNINMIPMIDLLMVTISFLLLTAVWTHSARLDASTQVPARSPDPPTNPVPEARLHVDMRSPDAFTLAWRQGDTVVDTSTVPREAVRTAKGQVDIVRYPALAARLEAEWRAHGQHGNPSDHGVDQAVLHAPDGAEFEELVGVMDAIQAPRRAMLQGGKEQPVSAFAVVFAVN